MVRKALTQLITHLRHRGGATAPHKIQGPVITVKFLGINWPSEGQEFTPTTLWQAQHVLPLFTFWRHINHTYPPYLAPFMQLHTNPLPQGKALQQVLQLTQKSNHQALPTVPSGSFFQVEALTTMYYSAWSLQTKCFPWLPLGFETTWLPFIVTCYTPLKHQILEVYWVLFQRQLNRNRSCSLYTVLLCTQIPITSCIRSATQ